MKRNALAVVFVATLACSAFAGEGTLTMIPRPEGAPATVSDAVAQLRASAIRPTVRSARTPRLARRVANAPSRVAPNVIEYETVDTSFIIPAAGSVQGANGTFFKSDVSIGNFVNTTQNIGVGWLAAGIDNTNAPLTYFTIPANTIASINDFVGTTLHKSGLGALLIVAYNAAGTVPDDNAILDGFSRIWTPQPGSSGTVSQSFPSVSVIDSTDDFTAYALGLRQDASFRTNVGVVNLDSATHTWTVTSLATGATMTLTVPPFSLGQGGVPASFAGSSGALSVTFDVAGTNIVWSAYASSVDNVTGDGWVSRATQ